MTGIQIAAEYEPLVAEQAAANAVADREDAASDQHFAEQARIPLPRRLDAAYAAEDAELAPADEDDDFEPDTCFYCQTTVNVTVHRYISGVYGVCDDDLAEHERTFPEAAALAAE